MFANLDVALDEGFDLGFGLDEGLDLDEGLGEVELKLELELSVSLSELELLLLVLCGLRVQLFSAVPVIPVFPVPFLSVVLTFSVPDECA